MNKANSIPGKHKKPINPKKSIIPATKKQEINKEEKKKDEIFATCSFSSLGLQPSLCDQLRDKMGFQVPTMVQAQTIPVALAGRHVLVNAATGTGKTIAYLAPIIHHLQMYETRIDRAGGTYALVLVPTRELCMQVYEILQKILQRFHWIVPGYVMGGENRSKEKARLRKGISVLVATPGRLLDHLKHTTSFVHSNLRWIIFDEADRILELGYGKEIEEILDFLGSTKNEAGSKENARPKHSQSGRQNLLLSATLNEKVNHLANISLENPVMIGIDDPKMPGNLSKGLSKHINLKSSDMDDEPELTVTLPNSSDADYNLPTQLVQRYVKVPCGARLVALLSVLKSLNEMETSQKVVVFFSTCDAVDFHFFLFEGFQWQSDSKVDVQQKKTFVKCKTFRLHGNMEHEGRRTTFHGFKTEKSAILLCTDVAARGLDFPDVTCIIQYDSPGEASEYVHRVGRTARLGAKGEALLFLQPIEIDYLHDLQKHGVTLQEYPLLKVLDSFPLHDQRHPIKKFVPIDLHPWVLSLQRALESFISSEVELKQQAKDAFCSWVRAYTAHRGELKSIFMVKKLHLGHVAKSFGLKDQPSLVGGAFQTQFRKRKKEQKQRGQQTKKRKVSKKA